MMSKGKIILVAVVLASLMAALILAATMRSRSRLAQLPQHEAKLDASDPRVRLTAADQVLALDSAHSRAMVVKAAALMDLGQFTAARQALIHLRSSADSPLRRQALLIRAQSVLVEAREAVGSSAAHADDLVEARIEDLLVTLNDVRAELYDFPDGPLESLILEIREAEVRAELLRLQLARETLEMTRAQSIALDEHVDMVGMRLSELAARLQQQDAKIVRLCEEVIAFAPHDSRGLALLFRARLRMGQLDDARSTVATLAEGEPLPPVVAGELADALLSLERRYGQPVTERDAELATRLLANASTVELMPLQYRLAEMNLQLYRRQWQQVLDLGNDILVMYPGHTRTLTTKGWALIGAGQARDAVRLMQPLVGRSGSGDVQLVLSVAMLELGDALGARDHLRQILAIDPYNLAARVAMARSLLHDQRVKEAEHEIIAALNVNPNHPQVMALHLQFMLDQLDFTALTRFVQQELDAEMGLQPRGEPLAAALAAAAVLDDVERVRQHMDDDGLPPWFTTLLNVWCQADDIARAEAATVLARVLLEKLDDDPLVRASPTLPRAADPGPAQGGPWLEPLSTAHFFHWPHELALELVRVTRHRWPSAPLLPEVSAELALWVGEHEQARRDLDQLRQGGELSERLASIDQYIQGHTTMSPAGDSPTEQWLQLAAGLARGDRELADAAFDSLMRRFGCAELTLLMTLRHAMMHEDLADTRRWLQRAETLQANIATLAKARLLLAQRQPHDAITAVSPLLHVPIGHVQIRGRAAEITARAQLMTAQGDAAGSVLESLAFTDVSQRRVWTLAAVDAFIATRRTTTASALLQSQLNDVHLTARWYDLLLSRAVVAMEPARVLALIEGLLTDLGDDPVLRYYHALASWQLGNAAGAIETLNDLLSQDPQPQRAALLWARVHIAQGRAELARPILQQLQAGHGPIAATARQELDMMLLINPPQPEVNDE